jgi:uncharacterized membrane protein
MRMIWRFFSVRPRLTGSAVIGMAAFWLLPASPLRALIAWDIFCAVFLAACALMFSIEPMARIARDARRDQEGEWTAFWVTVAAVAASFGAIVDLFTAIKAATPEERPLHIGLVVATLLLSWLTTHTLFALRYAHEYYDGPEDGSRLAGGIDFPGDEKPDYWDFFYFALVLGMTFQVSDVSITARPTRRLAAAHGLIGFLFNTVILALSVNIGASLAQ